MGWAERSRKAVRVEPEDQAEESAGQEQGTKSDADVVRQVSVTVTLDETGKMSVTGPEDAKLVLRMLHEAIDNVLLQLAASKVFATLKKASAGVRGATPGEAAALGATRLFRG